MNETNDLARPDTRVLDTSADVSEAKGLPDLVGAIPVAAAPVLWTLRHIRTDEDMRASLSFILSTWSDSYHDGSREVQHLAFRRYRDRMHKRIDRTLRRPQTIVVVASLPDDPTHLLGYLVHEEGTLHYVYVRPARRRYGLATALLEHWLSSCPAVEASHDTKQGAKIIRALNMTYNPLAVEGAE